MKENDYDALKQSKTFTLIPYLMKGNADYFVESLDGAEPLTEGTIQIDMQSKKVRPNVSPTVTPAEHVERKFDLKLDQVILESNQLTYSILLSGDLPKDVTEVFFDSKTILNGENIGWMAGGEAGSSVVDANAPIFASNVLEATPVGQATKVPE